MRRASYRAAVHWIAANDSSGDDLTQAQCAELITSALVADIFGVPDTRVGRDVHRARIKLKKESRQ